MFRSFFGPLLFGGRELAKKEAGELSFYRPYIVQDVSQNESGLWVGGQFQHGSSILRSGNDGFMGALFGEVGKVRPCGAPRFSENDAAQPGGEVLEYKSSSASFTQQNAAPAQVTFERSELNAILALYGRNVAAGEWRDYAIDFTKERAVFSVFRRSTEVPLYRIEKDPKLAKKQGAFFWSLSRN
eukprot:gene14333-14455_t